MNEWPSALAYIFTDIHDTRSHAEIGSHVRQSEQSLSMFSETSLPCNTDANSIICV